MHTPRRQTAYSLRFVAGNPDRLLVSILLISDRPEGIGVHRGDQREGRELGRARHVFDALDGVIQIFEQQRQADAGGQTQQQSDQYRAAALWAGRGARGPRRFDDAQVIAPLLLSNLRLTGLFQKVGIKRLGGLGVLLVDAVLDRRLILLNCLGLGGFEQIFDRFFVAHPALVLGLQTGLQGFGVLLNLPLQLRDWILLLDDLRVFRAEGSVQL